MYNTILLLCAHSQSGACCIQLRHARAHGHVTSSHLIMLINNHASTHVSLGRYLDAYQWPCSSFYNPELYYNHQRLHVSRGGSTGSKGHQLMGTLTPSLVALGLALMTSATFSKVVVDVLEVIGGFAMPPLLFLSYCPRS